MRPRFLPCLVTLGLSAIVGGCSADAGDGGAVSGEADLSAGEQALFGEMASAFSPSPQFRSVTSDGCKNIAGAALRVGDPARAVAALETYWQMFFRRPATLPIGMGDDGCNELAAVTPYLAIGVADPLYANAFAPKTVTLPAATGSPVSVDALASFLRAKGFATIRPDVLLYAFHLRAVTDANEARWASMPPCTRIDVGRLQLFRGLERPLDPGAKALGVDERYVTYRHSLADLSIAPDWRPETLATFLEQCPQNAPPAAPVGDALGEPSVVFSHELATYAPALGFATPVDFASVVARADVPSPPAALWAEALDPRSSLGTTLRVASHLLTEIEAHGALTFYGSIPYKQYYAGDYSDTSADYGPNVTAAYRITADLVRASLVALLTDDTLDVDGAKTRRGLRMESAVPGGKAGYLPFAQLIADRYFLPGPLSRPHFELVADDGAAVPPVASNVFAHQTFRILEESAHEPVTLAARYDALGARALSSPANVEAAVGPGADYALAPDQLERWFGGQYPSGGQPSKIADDGGVLTIVRRNTLYRYVPSEGRVRVATPRGFSVCDWGPSAACFQTFGKRVFFAKTIIDADDDGGAMGHSGLPGSVYADTIRRQGLVLVFDRETETWSRVPFAAAGGKCAEGVKILGLGLGHDHDNMVLDGDTLTLRCDGGDATIDLSAHLEPVTTPVLTALPVDYAW